MRVLLADDEVIIRNLIKQLLAPLQPPVEIVAEATNGKEAIELCKRYRPDVVITDIRMPKMGGLELLEQLRSENPTLPIILISAYDDFDYAKKALKNGAFDYLLKPIDEDELYRAVDRARKQSLSMKKQQRKLVKMETELRKLQEELSGEDELSEGGLVCQMDGKTAIKRAVYYIREQYASDLTLADVAQKVYLNPTYFSELFKKETGKGFSEYINGLRIEKAKKLLTVKTLKISEVAQMVGYRDTGYFAKQFYRYAQVSPNDYRKQVLEERKKEKNYEISGT